MSLAISWVEQGYVPDAVVRRGIRRLCEQRLTDIDAADAEAAARRTEEFVRLMDRSPIALVPELANAQHYEVPAEFFAHVLGPHRKYSSAWWPLGVSDLGAAEAAALDATCARAGLEDGQDILELGCGWGSLTLFMAARYPKGRITAVSNSNSQRAYIEAEARRRRLSNVRVVTEDMNTFNAPGEFDRVVSVEMFEHLRNWRAMFGRVAAWLKPGGRFFLHVFCHRSVPYAFEDLDVFDWMSRHFFSGGMMPSDELGARFQCEMRLVSRWRWDGTHYERTANAWLANMDANREALWPILERTYGAESAEIWWNRWRIFFMACAELFGYRSGQEWWVSHYLFGRPDR
jgi:cyclopropane-fatty-acyl-phospholipid synthase